MRKQFIALVLMMTWLGLPSSYGKLRLVMLDPGHGGSENKGAPARMRPGKFEKYYTLILSRIVQRHLEAAGIKTKLTRTTDIELGLKERVVMANKAGADAFISLHLNSTEKPGPKGHASFFLAPESSDEATRRLVRFENKDPTALKRMSNTVPDKPAINDILLDLTRHRAQFDSQRLAELIQERLTPVSPYPNRGVKQAPFGVLKGTTMPGVVCEIGFINHRREGLYITSREGLEEIGKAIARGIVDYGELVHDTRTIRKEKTP